MMCPYGCYIPAITHIKSKLLKFLWMTKYNQRSVTRLTSSNHSSPSFCCGSFEGMLFPIPSSTKMYQIGFCCMLSNSLWRTSLWKCHQIHLHYNTNDHEMHLSKWYFVYNIKPQTALPFLSLSRCGLSTFSIPGIKFPTLKVLMSFCCEWHSLSRFYFIWVLFFSS